MNLLLWNINQSIKNIEIFMMDVDDEGEPLGQFMKSFDELKPLVKNGFRLSAHSLTPTRG